jgi:ankyrin repeat protein
MSKHPIASLTQAHMEAEKRRQQEELAAQQQQQQQQQQEEQALQTQQLSIAHQQQAHSPAQQQPQQQAEAAATDAPAGRQPASNTQPEVQLASFKRLRHTVNARDLYRRTPLIVAAKQGHLECAHLLVDAASNLFAVDREGNT